MDTVSLLYSDNTSLGQLLRSSFENKLLILSNNSWNEKGQAKKTTVQMLSKLKEKISQAFIVIDSERDIKNIKYILEKIREDNGRSYVIARAKDEKLILKLPKEMLRQNVSLLLVGEVFGPLSESNESKIFQNALGTKEIELKYGKELPLAIVSETDLKEALSHLTNEKIGLLFYESPQTLQTAAFEIVKKNPDIKIVYGQNPSLEKIDQSKLIKKVTVQFETKPIYLVDSKNFKNSLDDLKPTKEKPKKKKIYTNKTHHIKTPALVFFLSLTLFAILTTALISLSLINAYNAKNSLLENNTTKALTSLKKANQYLTLTSPLNTVVVSYLPLNEDHKTALATSDKTLSLVLSTLEIIHQATAYQNFQNSQSAIAQLTYAYFKLSQNPLAQEETIQNVLGENTSRLASILQAYPDITGIKEEKNYLLLFQNNAELRPTGGFIGSVGELKLKDGKIQNLTIRDVYELDGQLKSHFEPHYIIRRNLQPHLYLRDSNFDIEFDTSAQQAARIYQSQTGKKIDGVIALDFEVLKAILKNAGEIKLPEHNLTLDEKTAQALIHDTIHENFFPGSTKKKDVLQSLMTRLLLKLETDPKLATSLAKEIPSLLEQKHIMFAFEDDNLQQLFQANGYAGDITDTRPKDTNTRNDILGVNEANIGVNKANENLGRKVEYEVFVGEESLVSKATLHIFNTAKNSDDYKTYVRFIVPKSSTIQSISIDGQEQVIVPAVTDPQIFESRTYTPPTGLEVDEKEELTYKTIGLTTFVPKNRTQQVTVLYTSGLTHNLKDTLTYSLMYIKQPGTKDYPFEFTLTHPESMTTNNEDFTIQKGKLIKNDVLTTDKTYNFTLIKN